MSDLTLQLGDFVFQREEIPEHIGFGGDQALVVHRLVGGARVIDSMGRDDMPLQWAGLLRGPNALDRARYLDGLRVAGNALVLSWHELQYMVAIRTFHASFERFYQIPYSITCEVIQDLTTPVTTISGVLIDDAMTQDMANANTYGGLIADSSLTSMLSSLDSAIRQVSSFANAVQTTINSVLIPLAAVQARVKILVGSTGNVISNVATLGGILPNTPIAQQAAKLNSQVAAMTQLPQLYNLQAVLGRMGANLGTIGTGAGTVTQAGGNLFDIAANQYGDATEWTTLAKANKLADPQLVGVNTIKVPATGGNSGGVLQP